MPDTLTALKEWGGDIEKLKQLGDAEALLRRLLERPEMLLPLHGYAARELPDTHVQKARLVEERFRVTPFALSPDAPAAVRQLMERWIGRRWTLELLLSVDSELECLERVTAAGEEDTQKMQAELQQLKARQRLLECYRQMLDALALRKGNAEGGER